MFRRRGADSSGGYSSVGSLDDVVLHVGSPLLGRLGGLGGLARFSLPLCDRCSASSVAVCFYWPFFSFFSVVNPLCACGGQFLFGRHQVMSVICFPLNEIRAMARSQKRTAKVCAEGLLLDVC